MTAGEPFAAGDPQLLFDQIQVIDQLGDRMFDLQTGIHLEKKELPLFVEDEFDRPGIDIAGRSRQIAGQRTHFLPQSRIEGAGGRFLDDLLVAPLDRAFPLPEVDDIAVLVRQIWISICRGLLIYRSTKMRASPKDLRVSCWQSSQRRGHILGPVDGAHTLAATAAGRFQQHRIAHLLRRHQGLFKVDNRFDDDLGPSAYRH